MIKQVRKNIYYDYKQHRFTTKLNYILSRSKKQYWNDIRKYSKIRKISIKKSIKKLAGLDREERKNEIKRIENIKKGLKEYWKEINDIQRLWNELKRLGYVKQLKSIKQIRKEYKKYGKDKLKYKIDKIKEKKEKVEIGVEPERVEIEVEPEKLEIESLLEFEIDLGEIMEIEYVR